MPTVSFDLVRIAERAASTEASNPVARRIAIIFAAAVILLVPVGLDIWITVQLIKPVYHPRHHALENRAGQRRNDF
ncbi:hypothetical protein AN936_08410 [Sphingopyxis macrogoltabida]|uniref:Uncharacterized protein n=1 Tax=Sphingopyxis macrogoltabida TaxID=33050 RepID=A0A0N9UX98_SPHMC|nr:hypothetical protein AN936_08410 [Sphingopyxis macrogoltabida]